MIAKVLFACLCSALVMGQGHARSFQPAKMNWFELQPARAITENRQEPDLEVGAIFKNCGQSSDKFKLTGVTVEGCTASPCILKKGTEAKVEIDFIANEVTPNITADVYGEILGAKVPFPLTEPDGCKCGVTCPTKVGTAYKYKYSLPVAKEYPSLTVPVLWYLYDAQKNEGLCMSVLAKITS